MTQRLEARVLATPGSVEGAGPHLRFCGGWAKHYKTLPAEPEVGRRGSVAAPSSQPASQLRLTWR